MRPSAINATMEPASHVMSNARLSAAVEQCLDALCFGHGHVLDLEFRVHPVELYPNVEQLQLEQKRRVHSAFGPAPPTPEFIHARLEELYGADAYSVTHPIPGEPDAIEVMAPAAARVFKKEMKQRIHEWEGAVRRATGRDPTPADKASMRPIYELYKAVKTKVETEDAAHPQTPAAPTVPTPARAPGASTTPSQSARPQQPEPRYSNPGAAPSPAAATLLTRPTPLVQASSGQGSAVGTPGSAARPSSGQAAPAPSSLSGTPRVNDGDVERAREEKRQLKRQLHEYENQFKAAYGRPPGKDDRRPMQREYQRYGELKQYLAMHAPGEAD